MNDEPVDIAPKDDVAATAQHHEGQVARGDGAQQGCQLCFGCRSSGWIAKRFSPLAPEELAFVDVLTRRNPDLTAAGLLAQEFGELVGTAAPSGAAAGSAAGLVRAAPLVGETEQNLLPLGFRESLGVFPEKFRGAAIQG